MSAILRPHQTHLLAEIDRALADNSRHLVVQAPTGFGKTIVGATLAKRIRDDRRRALFTVPALSLIDQTVEKFFAKGVRDVGVIQANHELTDWSRPVTDRLGADADAAPDAAGRHGDRRRDSSMV